MLWQHQIDLAAKAVEILKERKIVYLAMEMRVGKTLIALESAYRIGAKNVLFVTKKKAIQSIYNDYFREDYYRVFNLIVTNYEQVHKHEGKNYDLVIVDEAHSLGAYPRPSLRTKRLKKIVQDRYLILLSGTPTPEGYSQIYHQFWISANSPFAEKNFYRWADKYVAVRERVINGYNINDYSQARKELILPVIMPYFLTFTRQQAGFTFAELDDEVLYMSPNPLVYKIVDTLIRRRYFLFPTGEEIVADSAAKLLQKIHQIYSGTVICENGKTLILDKSKAYFIRDKIGSKNIAIYYKFKAEYEVLKEVFPNHTTDPLVFSNHPDLVFLSQIQSGSMGIDLSAAKAIVFYNIDFSFTNYWQARSRVQGRFLIRKPKIYWIFTERGIEKRILDVVRKKKDYTTYYFRRDFGLFSDSMLNKIDKQ